MTSTTRRTRESLSKRRLPELQARFAEIVGGAQALAEQDLRAAQDRRSAEAREQKANAEPTTPATTTTEASPKVKLTKLSKPELQAMYLEVVGRETRSSDSVYLVWKLRLAQKGRVRAG